MPSRQYKFAQVILGNSNTEQYAEPFSFHLRLLSLAIYTIC